MSSKLNRYIGKLSKCLDKIEKYVEKTVDLNNERALFTTLKNCIKHLGNILIKCPEEFRREIETILSSKHWPLKARSDLIDNIGLPSPRKKTIQNPRETQQQKKNNDDNNHSDDSPVHKPSENRSKKKKMNVTVTVAQTPEDDDHDSNVNVNFSPPPSPPQNQNDGITNPEQSQNPVDPSQPIDQNSGSFNGQLSVPATPISTGRAKNKKDTNPLTPKSKAQKCPHKGCNSRFRKLGNLEAHKISCKYDILNKKFVGECNRDDCQCCAFKNSNIHDVTKLESDFHPLCSTLNPTFGSISAISA